MSFHKVERPLAGALRYYGAAGRYPRCNHWHEGGHSLTSFLRLRGPRRLLTPRIRPGPRPLTFGIPIGRKCRAHVPAAQAMGQSGKIAVGKNISSEGNWHGVRHTDRTSRRGLGGART